MQPGSAGSRAIPAAIFAVFVLSVWIALAVELRYDRQRTLAEAESRLATRSFLMQEWIVGAFQGSDYVLRDLIGHVDPGALRFPPPTGAGDALVALLRAKQATLPNAYVAGFFDADCRVVHATLPVAGFDASGRDYCQAFLQDPALETYVSPLFLSSVGRYTITQARIVRRADGSRAGLAAVGIDPKLFDAWLERTSLPNNGVVGVVDSNMLLVARKPALPEGLGKTAAVPGLAEFLASPAMFATRAVASPVDGVTRLYAARKVGELPFVAVAGEDLDGVLAAWWRKLWIYVTTGATIALLALAVLRHHRWRLRQHEELLRLAITDPLTGVANRRHFLDQLQAEFVRSQRLLRPFGLLILDIDLFKLINDTFGHLVGDDAIRAVMLACRNSIRQIDFLGRIGGEEFAIILPETTLEEALTAAERVRQAVADVAFDGGDGKPIALTVSVGVTEPDPADGDGLQVLGRADKALYDAKRSGRNRVCSRSRELARYA